MNDEAEVVAGLRAGQTRAFDVAFDHWHSPVLSFLVRLCGQRALAEDLTQETFLRLCRHASRLNADTRLGPWLFRVARNLFVSSRRGGRREFERLEQLTWLPTQAVPTPLECACASGTHAALAVALADMPMAHREVLLLSAVLEPRDMAAVLGVTAEAARQRLARARAVLATMMPGGGR